MKQIGLKVHNPILSLETIYFHLRWETKGLVTAAEMVEWVMQFWRMGRVS